ncbi:MAG TPA: hypothetical protein VFJ70_21255 [Burkholderiales bacterium]|nr:hypothetical protein [Burkholderiales bacterium]
MRTLAILLAVTLAAAPAPLLAQIKAGEAVKKTAAKKDAAKKQPAKPKGKAAAKDDAAKKPGAKPPVKLKE